MPGENLNRTDDHPVIRIGDTVHRPVGWWTPAVHGLLKYLESTGFKYSPRVLGFDEDGREVLSFIDGESGKDSWAKVISDNGLRKYAKLLRGYHEAVADFRPPTNSMWGYGQANLKSNEIICHGDFGPWNTVWQGEEPVGIIDWDFVLPAKPRFDVLYGLEYAVPFRNDEACLNWHHFPEVPDRKHRVKVFAEAYGTTYTANIAQEVADMQRAVGKYEEYLAKKGLQPQGNWVANGDLEVIEKRAKWTEAHKDLFV